MIKFTGWPTQKRLFSMFPQLEQSKKNTAWLLALKRVGSRLQDLVTCLRNLHYYFIKFLIVVASGGGEWEYMSLYRNNRRHSLLQATYNLNSLIANNKNKNRRSSRGHKTEGRHKLGHHSTRRLWQILDLWCN